MTGTMMIEDGTYADVLESLKSPANKRDPRAIRLAAVAAAMSDVVGSDATVSAAKVYAATISALEGTLKEQSPQETLDSLSTQVALLELFRVTVPYMENPAILSASLPVSSRVLRGIVSSSLAIDGNELQQFDTKDELGGINAVLRGLCRSTAEILRMLSPKTTTDDKALKQFYHGTLMALFDDHRPKVRKASHNSIADILFSENCHQIIVKSTTTFAHGKLRNALKKLTKEAPQPELLHLLSFLERCIGELNISVLGTDLMELLVALLKETASNAHSDFVAMSKKDSTPRILAINGIFAAVKELLECSSEKTQKQIDSFAPRALASLLQMQPSLVFMEGSADLDLLHRGRTLYGHVVLSCCQRVIASDPNLACKLMPVAVQVVLQLCRMGEEEVDEAVTEPLMADLSALFRSQIHRLQDSNCSQADLDTCITGCLKALEKVTLPAFQATWSVSLKTLVILLQKFDTHKMAPSIVTALLELRNSSEGDLPSQRAVEAAIGSLIEGIGIEQFWETVDWTDKDSRKGTVSGSAVGINMRLSWLLPVCKTASAAALGRRPHLAFFQKKVLGLARACASSVTKASDKIILDKWVIGLWNLFPCFCQHPMDLEETFPNLIPTLVKAMEDKRYPQLLSIICQGLEILSDKVKERLAANEEIVTDVIIAEESNKEKEVLSKGAEMLLPALFKNVERLHAISTESNEEMDVENDEAASEPAPLQPTADSTQRITQAIASLAGLAPTSFLQKLFKKLMKRLLEESQNENEVKDKLCSLLNLSQALVASEALDEASVMLLYRTMKPMIRSDEHGPKAQKLAYKVLAEICNCHHAFMTESSTMKELVDLLTGTALTSQVSARGMRLKCMSILVDGFEEGSLNDSDSITKMTGEVLLCLKDSKAKTRDTAYQILISLANATGNMTDFLRVIAAALGAETSHMRSAAVLASSRLVFEFAREDDSLQGALPSLLQTILILFNEQSREVIKSAVGFVRVCVAAMQPEQLRPLLPDVVGSILKHHKGKDRFRAKIKIILKKLIKLYGYETLMPLVPESETRLLTHMRKLEERAARRRAANREDGAQGPQNFDDMVDSDEYDSDEGRTLMTGATGLTRKTAKTQISAKSGALSQTSKTRASSVRSKATMAGTVRLPSENDGEIVNILNLNKKQVQFADDDSDSDSDGILEFDDHGRLVVNDDDDMQHEVVDMADAVHENVNIGSNSNKRRKLNKSGESESVKSGKSKGKNDRNKKVRDLGASYKSRKAGGDVKKKGQKFEPYAYVPLDGRSYSKKNRRRAVEQMATVVPQGGKRKRK